MKKRILTLILTVTALVSCNVSQELTGAYNMINCKYDYKSISNLNIAGINASNGLNLSNIAKVTSILSGTATSIPLQFDLNLNVNNPNASAALLHGLQYIISIDDIQFTTGMLNQSLNIASGQTQTIPLTIGLDLATLMKNNSKDAVVDIAKNFLGMGSRKSNVKLQVRPTFMVGNIPITSPSYIPINFSFGGGK